MRKASSFPLMQEQRQAKMSAHSSAPQNIKPAMPQGVARRRVQCGNWSPQGSPADATLLHEGTRTCSVSRGSPAAASTSAASLAPGIASVTAPISAASTSTDLQWQGAP